MFGWLISQFENTFQNKPIYIDLGLSEKSSFIKKVSCGEHYTVFQNSNIYFKLANDELFYTGKIGNTPSSLTNCYTQNKRGKITFIDKKGIQEIYAGKSVLVLKDFKSKLHYYNYKGRLKQLDFGCERKSLCVLDNDIITIDRKTNEIDAYYYQEDSGYSQYDMSPFLSLNCEGKVELIPTNYYLNFLALLDCETLNLDHVINSFNKSINLIDNTSKLNSSKIRFESFLNDTATSPVASLNKSVEKSRINESGSYGINSLTFQRGFSTSSTFPKNEIKLRNRHFNAISPNHYKIHTMYSLLDRVNKSVDFFNKSSHKDKFKKIENLLKVSGEKKKTFNISTIKADRSHYVNQVNDVNHINLNRSPHIKDPLSTSQKKAVKDLSSSLLSQTSVTSDSNRKNKNVSMTKNIVIHNESFLLSTPTKIKKTKEDSIIKEESVENKPKPYQKKVLSKSSLSVSKVRSNKIVKLISSKIKTSDKMDFLTCDKNKADLIISNALETEEKRNRFEPLELETQSIQSINSKLQSTLRSGLNENTELLNSRVTSENNKLLDEDKLEKKLEIKLDTPKQDFFKESQNIINENEKKNMSLNSSIFKSQKLNAVDIYTIKARENPSIKNRTRNPSLTRKKQINLGQVKSKNINSSFSFNFK